MSFLEITRLRKTFGRLVAVDDVSFCVESNETFGLLGPNGAGKSTTMMMLAGLIQPDSGGMRLDGRELAPGDRLARRPMGVVPQDLAIYPRLTARENLTFFGRLYGLRGAKLKQRTGDILQLIGLTDRANSVTETFSGGMKRRLNFGVALLHEPRLLILDEPTVGVDPQSRAYLLQCVKDLCAGGVCVIYCSHYMEEVQELCNRVAIIDHGRVLACDRIDRLLGRVNSEVRLHVTGIAPAALARLNERPGVEIHQRNSHVIVAIQYADAEQSDALASTLTAALREIETAGGAVERLDADEPDLERLFLRMTGSNLRD
jgi:linearmycin/streptolysin S transport system ATP-binding protein